MEHQWNYGYRDIIPLFGNVHISVSAVSKCSHQGLRSSAIIEWRDGIDRPMCTSGPNNIMVKTDKVSKDKLYLVVM